MQLKNIICLFILFTMSSIYAQQNVLTMEKLDSLVIQRNPELIVLLKEIKASKGALLQKSLRLNPELEVESGTGIDPETVLQLNQTLELGGKRHKRTRIGELGLKKSKHYYQVRQLRILNDAKSALIDVLVNQELIELIEERVRISQEFLSTVKKKVSAGRFSPAEESRAKITLVSYQIELSRYKRILENRWKVLASFWESTTSKFDSVTWDLSTVDSIPSDQQLLKLIRQSPMMELNEINIQIQQSVVILEQANRIPNLTIGPGIKRIEIPGNTYELGVSMSLPLFNRNQGAIIEANARLEQARENRELIDIQLKTIHSTTYSKLQIAYDIIQSLKSTILPEAEKAYQIISEGYLQGKFDYLDIADAQNTLFESKRNQLTALSDYHKARFELEGLLGQSFRSIVNTIEE